MTTNKPQKLSWQFDDLAQKVQVAPRHLAAKLVLQFLAKKSNDSGESWHGYESIAAHCSLSRSQTALALKYLRDKLKLVSWTKGTGGSQKQSTNIYALNLQCIQDLIKAQGVFDPETGKLIRVESDNRTGVESDHRTGLVVKSSPMKPLFGYQSSPMKAKVESDDRTVTTIEPPNKNNPQLSVDDGGFVFSDKEPKPDNQTDKPDQSNQPDKQSLPEGFVWEGDVVIQVGA